MTGKTKERLDKKLMGVRHKVALLLDEIEQLEGKEKCVGDQYGLIRMKNDITSALNHLDFASCEFE